MPTKKNVHPNPSDEPDYQVRWKNFRGFKDTNWVEFRPLTILIGPNNAGKTSVLAPLLLLNQTMRSNDALTPLVTKGPLIDAGTFENIVRNNDTGTDVFFGIRFHVHDEHSKPLKKVGTYAPGALEVTFGAAETPYACKLKSFDVYDTYLQHYLSLALQANGHYSISGIPTGRLRKGERLAIEQTQPTNFLFSPAREISNIQEKKDDELRSNFSLQFNLYLAIIGFVFTEIRTLLSELSYIGPIRERPRHSYEISADRPRTVGASGERAPNLLRIRHEELNDKLSFWIRAFEMGDRLELTPISPTLFEIKFVWDKPRRVVNIADAGFGASQVLPLIVQAIAADEGSLTLAEQPEIHLNPKLQGVLADLFVEMANTGRRVVVETHSEHLILRLRTLIASGKIAQDKVALYYVEKNGGDSRIRQVPIQENGNIVSNDWPRGFFGETLSESLALAKAQTQVQATKSRKR